MATKTKRRQPDHILERGDIGDSIAEAIHHAILPLDKIATDMEMKWGCDRLPSLVDPEMAARFGAAKAKLDAAIVANDPEDVVRRTAVLARGWAAMDREAERLGNAPLSPDIWSHTTDGGFRWAVARSNADAIKAIRSSHEFDGVAVYSLDEVGRILEAHTLTKEVKRIFPECTVEKIK